jgi:hypothetical protein
MKIRNVWPRQEKGMAIRFICDRVNEHSVFAIELDIDYD